MVAALIVVVALGTLVGWLGLRVYDSRQIAEEHAAFLATARQGALNLTTISHTEVEDDINRILNTATGSFHDEFRERSVPFVDAVRGAQSTSQGTVIEAALESVQGDTAEALVSVAVTTSVAGAPPQEPRSWRMRITVQKDGDTDKVSNVEFVP